MESLFLSKGMFNTPTNSETPTKITAVHQLKIKAIFHNKETPAGI